MAKKRNATSWQTIAVVVLVAAMLLSLLGLNIFSGLSNIVQKPSAKSSRELALQCISHQALSMHIHPELEIRINGEKQEIPQNVGVEPDCLRAIHTHDEPGIIHVESPEVRDFHLGDFFAVWGKQFSKDQIFDKRADALHEVVMTVNGTPSEDYDNLVLRDKDKIVIEYRQKQNIQLEVKTDSGENITVTPR